MGSIASVFVDFIARTAGFQQGVQEAANSVKQAGNQMQESNKQTAAASDKMTQSMEKGFLRVALGAHAFGLIRREIEDVIKNIDSIPGISDSTLESIHRLKFAFEDANGGLKGYIATAVGWVTTLDQGISAGAAGLIYGFDAMKQGWNDLNSAAEKFAEKEYQKKISEIQVQMDRLKLSSGEAANAIAREAVELEKFASGSGGTQQERWDASIKAAKDWLEVQREVNKQQAEYMRLANGEDTIQNKYRVSLMGAAEAMKFLREKKKELIAQENEIVGDNFSDFSGDPAKLEQYNAVAKKVLETSKLIAETAKKAQKPFEEIAKFVGDNLTQAFVDVFSGAQDGFKKLGQSILREIEMIVVRILIVKPLMASIGGVLSGIGGGIVGALGTAFTSYAGAMAGGGDIGAGQFAMVGENGPELLAKPGTVVSNDKIASALGGSRGGGDTFVTIDATGADAGKIAQLEAVIKSLHMGLEKRAVAAVVAARRMGGGTGAALA